jgi:hypothetical protein
LDGANGWNEDRRENPEYAARGSSDCKMHGVMQRVLEVTSALSIFILLISYHMQTLLEIV